MARLLTQAQFARKTKYSRARITQLVKQGVIILKNGKVDPGQAGASMEANIDRSRQIKVQAKTKATKTPQLNFTGNGFNTDQQKPTPPDEFNTDPSSNLPSLTDARRNRELIRIQKELIELKKIKEELVPKGEANKMIVALGTATKLAFLNLPRRLAPTLKILTDEREIEVLLRSEIRNIIRTLGESHIRSKDHHVRDHHEI